MPILHKERQRIKTKVKQENDTRALSRIGETDNLSPATSCADSTAIADRYEKIAGLVVPSKALKKGKHASHVCQ